MRQILTVLRLGSIYEYEIKTSVGFISHIRVPIHFHILCIRNTFTQDILVFFYPVPFHIFQELCRIPPDHRDPVIGLRPSDILLCLFRSLRIQFQCRDHSLRKNVSHIQRRIPHGSPDFQYGSRFLHKKKEPEQLLRIRPDDRNSPGYRIPVDFSQKAFFILPV